STRRHGGDGSSAMTTSPTAAQRPRSTSAQVATVCAGCSMSWLRQARAARERALDASSRFTQGTGAFALGGGTLALTPGSIPDPPSHPRRVLPPRSRLDQGRRVTRPRGKTPFAAHRDPRTVGKGDDATGRPLGIGRLLGQVILRRLTQGDVSH